MKKVITLALFIGMSMGAFAQWTPTKFKGKQVDENVVFRSYYSLDLNAIRAQLANAQPSGQNSTPVIISLPTLEGKIERFSVYSAPVVVEELANQYQLGSYAGVGIDDPTKLIRFSTAPNDFQAMIMTGKGEYQFISPVDKAKTVYGVHPKTKKTGDKPFLCSTEESLAQVQDIERLAQSVPFSSNAADFSRSSDKKYRTLRLAMSVTGEYTQYHGGTVAGALAAINATLTRVNGVFEKDFALHLNLQNFPNVIYTDPNTDPYSPAAQMNNWNWQLQQTLTANVGEANYDIGHLFGASGGGGNAGCIGCICVNGSKGSGYTSPANAVPMGDTFDIDYVAHELGHQLGANHTFSHALEGTGVNVEPGSGSSIMGYAGITGGPETDVQQNSDAYFHRVSINQVQNNLTNKTCDIETPITGNNPPVIAALPSYTIPKNTAFVLEANVTDPENDPMTYTWEQVDNASVIINRTNLGTTSTGGMFRSVPPTNTPVRYFPKWESVLQGALTNVNNTWESVSQRNRNTNFAITVRDNNADVTKQQTASATQFIGVGNDGPFQVTSMYGFSNVAQPITWDVANTNGGVYNTPNVKIDFTTDNGATWQMLAASTPNDGSENLQFPASVVDQDVIVRVSAIGNVFYAIKKVRVVNQVNCGDGAVAGVLVSNTTTTTATVNWAPVVGAVSYVVEYKRNIDTTWTSTTSATNSITLTNLADGANYEVRVAAVCSNSTDTFSPNVPFTTLSSLNYCTPQAVYATDDHITNVTLANLNNNSGASQYSNYTTDGALTVNLVKGQTYTISVSKGWLSGTPKNDAVSVWIDWNRDGSFAITERVLAAPASTLSPVTATFTVPATANVGGVLRMRVTSNYYNSSTATIINGCQVPTYGEVEDYSVVVSDVLATSEVNNNNGIAIYPNPAVDVINVKNIKDKTNYTIHNAAGQLVQSGSVNDGKVNVSKLVKGAYVISFGENVSHKFVKK